jgi:glycosyltransferase involved in cell wall biosynthesis
MKILYISFAFQHPKMRGSNRAYYFIRELSRRNEITLLTLSRSEIPAESFQEMTSYTNQIKTIDVNRITSQNSRNFNRRIERAWQERVTLGQMRKILYQLVHENPYDVVLFHGKSVASVIEQFNLLPITIDFCDATSIRIRAEAEYADFPKKMLMMLRYWRMRRIEKMLINKSPHLAFISCRDREAVLGPSSDAEVIPNGIDLHYWQRRSYQPQPNRLIFTGVMDYRPNEDAALYLMTEILPRLLQSIPDVELYIVGRDPTPKLCKMAQLCPQVTVTGFVQDMRDYLEQATVFVAPLRYASGMQNKIQEAFAMSIPVITTPVVAEGMVTTNREKPPLYVANGADEFKDRIINLLENADERVRLSQSGRCFAEANFVWSRSAEKLEKLCQRAVLTWSIERLTNR